MTDGLEVDDDSARRREVDRQLDQLCKILEQVRRERRTLTYLQAADAMALDPPHRIHKITRLLELLLNRDARAGRPLLAALVVSRVRGGLPGPGFFDRARRLGLFHHASPDDFHRQLLEELFDSVGKS